MENVLRFLDKYFGNATPFVVFAFLGIVTLCLAVGLQGADQTNYDLTIPVRLHKRELKRLDDRFTRIEDHLKRIEAALNIYPATDLECETEDN
jgi:hypothetical protein